MGGRGLNNDPDQAARASGNSSRTITTSARRLHRSQSLARQHMRHAIPPSGYPERAAHPDHRGPLADWSEDVHYELVRRDTS